MWTFMAAGAGGWMGMLVAAFFTVPTLVDPTWTRRRAWLLGALAGMAWFALALKWDAPFAPTGPAVLIGGALVLLHAAVPPGLAHLGVALVRRLRR